MTPTDTITPEQARSAITTLLPTIRQALAELVSFPSVHNYPGAEEANAQACQWVVNKFRALGIDTHAHRTLDGSGAVLGYKAPQNNYPTILLYSHFDVQPASDTENWLSDPWTLTERDGRWYGRGAADCKGNVVMHLAVLTALNSLAEQYPELRNIGLRIVVEGSEERGGEGLEHLLEQHPELFIADHILIADSGNLTLGVPAIGTALRGAAPITVTLETLKTPVHSGLFGGAAPDALLAMIQLLSTLHTPEGLVAVEGLNAPNHWDGAHYPPEQFREDAGVLDGVDLIAQPTPINDLVVARPSITVTALDAVPVKDAINAVPARSSAVVSLRVPPEQDPHTAQDLLVKHLENNVPWNAKVTMEKDAVGFPFSANLSGLAYKTLNTAMQDAYGKPVELAASGGSIPLCNKLLDAFPQAEVLLFGVEEPECKIHSANESVSPQEIMDIAVSELLFLARSGALPAPVTQA